MVPYQMMIDVSEGQKLVRLKQETLLTSEQYVEEENKYLVRGYIKKESKWNGEN